MSSTKSSAFTKAALALALAAGACATAGRARADLVQTINYANFNSTAGLTLNGVAVQSPGVGAEQMTLSITPPVRSASGSFYATARQKVDQGFVTDFRFRMRDRQGVGSDGMAFIIQNANVNATGGTGGGIGFGTNLAFPTGNTGIANSLAIVFDTWDNSANWPTIPGANVITVQTNGTGVNDPSSVHSLGGVPISGAFNDGAIHTARVVYVPGFMAVYYDNLTVPAVLINNINLSNTLQLTGGAAFVGFTGATGALVNVQRHEVLDWSFSSNIIPAPTAAGLVGAGGLAALRRRRR